MLVACAVALQAPVAGAEPTPSPAYAHHPVSTQNAQAQQAVDEGWTLLDAFNPGEAIVRFRRALALDPHLAMAWWGIAFALGPNINTDVGEGPRLRSPVRCRAPDGEARSALA